MSDYFLIADAVSPLAESPEPTPVAGLAYALAAAEHRVTLVTLATPERASATPGLARRLRKVTMAWAGETLELPLFEGRLGSSPAQLFVLGIAPRGPGLACAALAAVTDTLVQEGLVKPHAIIGWGDASAKALALTAAEARFFVLPSGHLSPDLSLAESNELGVEGAGDPELARSLAARGVLAGNALLVPSPSAARAFGTHPALAGRASDEPLLPIRFGCDEPPFDPAADPTLDAAFSVESPGGKAENRKQAARRAGLTLGPRTLILGISAPASEAQGRAILDALKQLSDQDLAVLIRAEGHRAFADQAAVLAIEYPGKIALYRGGGGERGRDGSRDDSRAFLAGLDALLLTDPSEITGRPAGLAQRYGTLPLAPEAGAYGDFLVDYDPRSATGSALLYSESTPFDLEGVVRRALALRGDSDCWTGLVKALLQAAPSWSAAAAAIESLREANQAAIPLL